jgi:ABC-type sugar transport system permease subunit
MDKIVTNIKKKKWWKNKDLLFYSLMICLPVIQFAVFYIGVNVNSILMAFQRIDVKSGTVEWTFDNLRQAFTMMTTSAELLPVLVTSILSYVLILVIGKPLGLFFSYYIYKKLPAHGGFRVILFLPSIISGIVMAAIYQFFFERAIPAMMWEFFGIQIKGLMENADTRYGVIIFYNVLMSFGTSVLMYANGMSNISQELVEAAHLDGASPLQEFWHITMPGVWPTLMTFLITGVAGIFTNQLGLFSFYGTSAPEEIRTYGYYFFTKTQSATSMSEYPMLSAMGLIMTLVVVPVTLLVKWALEKYGPSED